MDRKQSAAAMELASVALVTLCMRNFNTLGAVLFACSCVVWGSPGESSAFAAFVEPETVTIHTLSDPAATGAAQFGWAVADIGDTDGDGVRDIITCAPFVRVGGLFTTGKVYLFSGRTGQLRFAVSGTASQDRLGYAIAEAGDINGDGVPDLIAGAPRNAGLAGYARVYSGTNGAVLLTLNGVVGQQFGSAVCSPGDADKDGVPDLAVGAPGSATTPGSVHLFSGATGALIRSWTGENNGDNFGIGVGKAGNVDRDGIGDLLVGAKDAGPTRRGRVYLFSGADGTAILPPLQPNQTTGNDLGWFFVAGAGDVNADGVVDVYAGDFVDTASGNNPPSGRGYVWSGRDGNLLLDMPGASGDGAGPGRSAGDVNFDGHADIIVGSYTSSVGAASAGRVRVYSGKTGAVLRTITSSAANEQFGFDAVGLGDVNADCAADFLIAAATGNRVYIIAGIPTPQVADLNGDHAVNSRDLVVLLGRFGTSGPDAAPADLTGDGAVDVEDLLVMLARFGQTCSSLATPRRPSPRVD